MKILCHAWRQKLRMKKSKRMTNKYPMFEWSPSALTLDKLLPQIKQNETNNKIMIMITMGIRKATLIAQTETSMKFIMIMLL